MSENNELPGTQDPDLQEIAEVAPDGAVSQDGPAEESRPWHGAESPFEALYQWVKGELETLRGAALAARGARDGANAAVLEEHPAPPAPEAAGGHVASAAPDAAPEPLQASPDEPAPAELAFGG